MAGEFVLRRDGHGALGCDGKGLVFGLGGSTPGPLCGPSTINPYHLDFSVIHLECLRDFSLALPVPQAPSPSYVDEDESWVFGAGGASWELKHVQQTGYYYADGELPHTLLRRHALDVASNPCIGNKHATPSILDHENEISIAHGEVYFTGAGIPGGRAYGRRFLLYAHHIQAGATGFGPSANSPGFAVRIALASELWSNGSWSGTVQREELNFGIFSYVFSLDGTASLVEVVDIFGTRYEDAPDPGCGILRPFIHGERCCPPPAGTSPAMVAIASATLGPICIHRGPEVGVCSTGARKWQCRHPEGYPIVREWARPDHPEDIVCGRGNCDKYQE